MYTVKDFPSKAALKRAIAAGEKIEIFAPGLGTPVMNGQETLEGPHYPKPHSWYARVLMEGGYVTKVLQ